MVVNHLFFFFTVKTDLHPSFLKVDLFASWFSTFFKDARGGAIESITEIIRRRCYTFPEFAIHLHLLIVCISLIFSIRCLLSTSIPSLKRIKLYDYLDFSDTKLQIDLQELFHEKKEKNRNWWHSD